MTAIKKLIDGSGNQYFPQTHTKAVIDDYGNSVEGVLDMQTQLINQAQMEAGTVPSDNYPTEGSTNWVTSGGVFSETHVGNENVEIDLTEYTAVRAYPNPNTWVCTNNTYPYNGKFIPVTALQRYKIVAQNSTFTEYAFLTSNTYSQGATVQYATGSIKTTLLSGQSVVVTAPINATYLWVSDYTDADRSPAALLEYNKVGVREIVTDLDSAPTKDSDKLISSGAVYEGIYEAAIMEDVPFNYTIGYKLNENGALVADENYGVSDFLECAYKDKITSYHGNTDTVASMVVYNSSKTKRNYYRNNTSPSRTAEVSNTDVAYFRVCFNMDYAGAGAAVNGVRVFTAEGGIKTAKDGINELQDEIDAIPTQTDEAIDKALATQNTTTKNLYLGTLVNAAENNGELSPSSSYADRRVINKSMFCVPFQGVKVTYKIPDNIAIVFKTSDRPTTTGNQYSSGWLTNATTSYTFPQEARVYRIIFANNNTDHTGNITAATVQGLIDNGDIRFTYEDPYPNVLERNTYKSNLLRAALAVKPGHEPCILSHISDVHGDVVRLKNFYDYSKYLQVDACLATGDFVSYGYGNRNEFINEVFDGDILALWVVGNHEFKNIGSADSYAEYTQTLAERYNYLSETGVVSTHNYYYYDIADKNIRVIAIDQYNGYYGSWNLGGKIGQAQLDWLVATLGSTPAGYGVCIILHEPESAMVKDNDYATFYEPANPSYNGFYESTELPITHIVDAFINKSTWSASYTNAQSESISISCDFTNRDATTEFIAYFCGHTHRDRVGIADIQTSRQVIFSTNIGNGLYGPTNYAEWCNGTDLPRGGCGVCQDCFNIYSIERSTKTIRVIRIGSDLTKAFADRKYMEIPYATV